jgi:hypothetical protein
MTGMSLSCGCPLGKKIKPVTRKNQELLQDCRPSSGYSKRTFLAGQLAVSIVDRWQKTWCLEIAVPCAGGLEGFLPSCMPRSTNPNANEQIV